MEWKCGGFVGKRGSFLMDFIVEDAPWMRTVTIYMNNSKSFVYLALFFKKVNRI